MKLTKTVQLGIAALALSAGAAFAEADQHPLKVGTIDEFKDISQFCGTKPLRVAYSTGSSGDPWRKISKAEFELEAAKCPNIKEARYVDARGSVEQQISDITGLAAQGFDVIVVRPDGGQALLRAMSQAMKRGAKVVPFYGGTSWPGTPGKDYVGMVTADQNIEGEMAAKWIVKQLNGEGNVIMLGGAPGADSTQNTFDGAMSVFKDHPGIKMLEDAPVTTNWDRAQYQQVMTSLLAKYPKIDAVISDYGIGSMGAIRAYEIAGKKIPLWATRDGNELACYWKEHHADNPDFQLFTTSAGTWLTRLALRKGVAAANDIENDEPTIIIDPVIDETTSDDPKKAPVCDPDLPMGAHVSSFTMTKEQMQDVFK
ncbi:substrate-binding domain-containing protein [Thioclava sp. GXIMD2076]|uniref:Substrate-binding domain-containing protein n=1 Tax=Thioclava kandeliae TaxID=3070818 RepID=A0ABV1SDY4_9RHOB